MDSVTLEAAAASVEDDAYFRDTCAQVMRTRERASAELQAL